MDNANDTVVLTVVGKARKTGSPITPSQSHLDETGITLDQHVMLCEVNASLEGRSHQTRRAIVKALEASLKR